MDGLTQTIVDECPGHLAPKMSTFVRMNKNTYFIAESRSLRVLSECTDPSGGLGTFAIDIPAGSYFLTVDPLCTTNSDHWVISPVVAVEDVRIKSLTVPNRINAQDFLGDLPLPDIHAIAETIKSIGQPIPLSHMKGLVTFQRAIQRENFKYSLMHTFWVAAVIITFLLAIGCILYFCCGDRI
jgi:hypothetical protein